MQRIYINNPIDLNTTIALSKPQSHYIKNVLRGQVEDNILVFNGRDGEFKGKIISLGKAVEINIIEKNKEQETEQVNLTLIFAPIKFGRIDYLVQKATELGVSKLQPVFTGRTIVKRINLERLRANIIEATEQSERLTIPEIGDAIDLEDVINQNKDMKILLCDETLKGKPIYDVLTGLDKDGNYGILIGPEGGFTQKELASLHECSNITPVSLGKRILRADTAAVASLACFQCIAGDWQ